MTYIVTSSIAALITFVVAYFQLRPFFASSEQPVPACPGISEEGKKTLNESIVLADIEIELVSGKISIDQANEILAEEKQRKL